MTEHSAHKYHVSIEQDGQRALDALVEASGLSRQKVKQAMQKGAVWWRSESGVRRLRRATRELSSGDSLDFYYSADVLAMQTDAARLIADEETYSVWCKPRGMLSQGSKWGDHCTIYRWAEQNLSPQRPALTVHRLDRAASGLMLLAHTKSMAAALARLFQNRKIDKRYRVIVAGCFPLAEEPMVIDETLDGKQANSRCSCLEYDETSDRSLLEVLIETGRKHQVRRHLASMGFPIIGDRLYGQEDQAEDLQLTASYLGFSCPASGVEREYVLSEEYLPRL
jgi:tRNA pseudouridine32 synthase/23S rRNA pseudouridine746 synthase